jgi:hypothetical protein
MSSGYNQPFDATTISRMNQPRPKGPDDVVVHNPFQMQLDANPEFARPASGGGNIRDLINRLRQRPTQMAPPPQQQAPAEPKSVLRRE